MRSRERVRTPVTRREGVRHPRHARGISPSRLTLAYEGQGMLWLPKCHECLLDDVPECLNAMYAMITCSNVCSK